MWDWLFKSSATAATSETDNHATSDNEIAHVFARNPKITNNDINRDARAAREWEDIDAPNRCFESIRVPDTISGRSEPSFNACTPYSGGSSSLFTLPSSNNQDAVSRMVDGAFSNFGKK